MATKEKEAVTSVADNKLCEYELVFIVKPEVEEEALENTIKNVSQLITGKGGTISKVDKWGKRKLAYPIKRSLEGSYILAQFKISPTSCKELKKSLYISEEILRHLLIKID